MNPSLFSAGDFRAACDAVAIVEMIDVSFYNDAYQAPFQDDGNLHVCAHSSRCCFEIGQDIRPFLFNAKVKRILSALGLPVNSEALQ